MLGKRPRSLNKTLRAVAMAMECAPGESMSLRKLCDDQKDKLNRCGHPPSPSIQVIGFHPKVCCGKAGEDEKKPNDVSPKSAARRTSGLECLLSKSPRSSTKTHPSVQTVGLGLVVEISSNLSQQNQAPQNATISEDCSCLLHAVSSRADEGPSNVVDPPVVSKPIPITTLPFQQPSSLCQFVGKSSHRPAPPHEQNPSGLTAEIVEGSNLSEKCVFSLLASSPGTYTYTAVSACLETMDFMESCFLCKRVLGHGRDIFMYRGDRAFCSAECRHQQIVLDERAERRQKCTSAAFNAANGAQSQRRSHRNRVVSAGTAAAA